MTIRHWYAQPTHQCNPPPQSTAPRHETNSTGAIGSRRLASRVVQWNSAEPHRNTESIPHGALSRRGLVRLSLDQTPFARPPQSSRAPRQFADLRRYTDSENGELVSAIAAKEGIVEEQIIWGEVREPLGTRLEP